MQSRSRSETQKHLAHPPHHHCQRYCRRNIRHHTSVLSTQRHRHGHGCDTSPPPTHLELKVLQSRPLVSTPPSRLPLKRLVVRNAHLNLHHRVRCGFQHLQHPVASPQRTSARHNAEPSQVMWRDLPRGCDALQACSDGILFSQLASPPRCMIACCVRLTLFHPSSGMYTSMGVLACVRLPSLERYVCLHVCNSIGRVLPYYSAVVQANDAPSLASKPTSCVFPPISVVQRRHNTQDGGRR